MPEFDILGHFSVNLDGPSTAAAAATTRPPVAPSSSRQSNDVKILSLRAKPPPPPSYARSATPQTSVSRGVSPSRTIVLDAPVPCNDYINQQAALARQREREQRRLRDQQAAAREMDLFVREERRGMTVVEKEALRVELERAVRHAREEKAARRQQELRDARVAQFHFDAAADAERIQSEAKRIAGLQLRDELRRRAEESRANRIAQRRAASAAPEDHVEPLYLTGQIETARNMEAARQRQRELRHYWEEQMVTKRSASAAARERDRLFAQEAEMLATRDEHRDTIAAAQAKKEAQKNLHFARLHKDEREQRRREERERERVEAERETAVAVEAERREAEVKTRRQQQLRDDIARLMAERKRQQQERVHVEKVVERNRAAAVEDAQLRDVDTMYRCPATGRVLPPAAFNIPRTAWQAPSRAVIM